MNILDLAIIGGGPAGIAAGIQLKRYGYNPVLFEKEKIGGLIRSANLVENYPGFASGITGQTLADQIEKHLNQWRIKVYIQEVEKVDYLNDLFIIKTDCGEYLSKILLIASGTKPKILNILNLAENTKAKIFYELNPLSEVQNKHICIIGGGDAAFDYALNLAKQNRVSIFYRSAEPRCLPLLSQRASVDENIKCFQEVIIDNIEMENNNLVFTGLRKKQSFEFKSNYLLVAIGREENLDFMGSSIYTGKNKLMKMRKLYLIGDVKNGNFRQISLAAADGIKAAMDIYDKNIGLK